jgi:dTMP kinase
MTRGVFITFEGGEGSGKSTQVQLLARALAASDREITVTREPGGAPGAEQIRSLLVNGETGRWDPLSEALLHYAARREHLRHTILPALAGGRWVVCDRFADSTMAYQGYGHELGREVIAALHAAVVGNLAPNLTLILDIPTDAGLARAASRGGEDRYERMDRTFHDRLREGFLDIARREPRRCAVIDATGTIEQVRVAICGVVHERLGVNIP